MPKDKIKILFFTPYAGYTGSEMMLWHMLCSLDREKFEVRLFALNNGKLLKEFPEYIKTDYSTVNTSLLKRLVDKLLKKAKLKGLEERQIENIHNTFKPDYWYTNTMVMTSVVDLAIKHNIKYMVHFHELLTQYSGVSAQQLKDMVSHAYYAIGCSQQVCENLKTLGAQRIHKQYECVDFDKIKLSASSASPLKLKHHINEKSFVVTMSGQRIDRKGFDLFIETAIRFKTADVHFLWLGSSKNSGYEFFLENKIKEHDLKNISIIAPAQNEYYDYLNLTDLFFLTSREDPFPLVMIEAGFLGKPILAFRSGGSEEFVQPLVGNIIPDFSDASVDESLHAMIKQVKEQHYHKTEITRYSETYSAKNQALLFQKWLSQTFIN